MTGVVVICVCFCVDWQQEVVLESLIQATGKLLHDVPSDQIVLILQMIVRVICVSTRVQLLLHVDCRNVCPELIVDT